MTLPNTIALRSGSAGLTYAELDRSASQLAAHLASLGVAEGTSVALGYTRGFDQITAALAVMRAGGAYIPLDPSWPKERIRQILEDSGAAVFIAMRELRELAPAHVTVLNLQDDAASIASSAPLNDNAAFTQDSLAYIIYTSGSTGTPKGVEITHGNLCHLIDWHCSVFGVTDQDRASHVAGLGFDASVWEVWPYLVAGASISLVDDMVRTSSSLLQQWLVDEKITIAFVPTPLAELMITKDWPKQTTLRFLLTGGDALHTAPKHDQPYVLINNYGPTECTVVATSGVVSAGQVGTPSIGKAIAGAHIYILNELGVLAAPEEEGELCIGGAGVGRGYRNQPELTSRSFVPDRFSDVPNSRLYKTGDRAVLLADGQIAFRGRMDNQEKIRGYRLELDEIVTVLQRHSAVAFSTVAPLGSGEEKHLVAYILPVEGIVPTARELQEYLMKTLPSYMIPAKFVRLTQIPLNASGKVDRQGLPAITSENTLSDVISRPPASAIEEKVLAVVRELLKTQNVGVEDDFFLLGGHSLMGTRLVMRLRETFGVSLTLRDLFDAGTVEKLSSEVENLLLAELDAMSDEEAISQVAG